MSGVSIGKNTVVSLGIGTLISILAFVWIALGIGRPLFASDLLVIEDSIENLDKKTSVAILNLAKQNLQSELRLVKRELRASPEDDGIEEDIDEIEEDITDIDDKIRCYRTEGCDVEVDI